MQNILLLFLWFVATIARKLQLWTVGVISLSLHTFALWVFLGHAHVRLYFRACPWFQNVAKGFVCQGFTFVHL
jgi:hypothetical protein